MIRHVVRTLLGAALLCGGAAHAKPLYMTVPRAFGTHEKPVIEVAFERRGPVELRVVRPDSLDAFVASQANLRRSWEPVEAKENPGRYLARGLNAVRLPGGFLYRALNVDFRNELAAAGPRRPEAPPSERKLVRLTEGPEKLVGLPPGATVVRRQWLNLDLGGLDRNWSVPGFDEWTAEGGYEDRRVELEPLPAGVYLVQLVQGKVEGQVILVVTDLKVQVKQTDGEVLVRVAGADLAPVSGAEVQLGTAAGPLARGRTDRNGEARIDVKEPRLLVRVRAGKDVAIVDTDFYSTLAVTPDVFVYSDRPIYRPGDAVQFRGIVRQPDGILSRLLTPRSREVAVSLGVAEGKTVSTSARVDEFGSFSGSLQIPADVATGVVRLEARLDGKAHGAEARVQEYVKPTFYVEVIGDAETVQPGGTLKVLVRARRYAGGAPEKTRYEVFLHRAVVESPAWVDDAGLGAQGSAVTYGSASTTEGKLSVPERLYSSIQARGQEYAEDPWATAPLFDGNGEAHVEIPVPRLGAGDERFPWRYTLSIRARDDQGAFANGSRPHFLAPSEVIATIRPGAVVTVAGTEAPLAIRATTLSGRPFAGAKGKVAFVLRSASGDEKALSELPLSTPFDGVWRGKLPAPGPGTVIAKVTLFDAAGRPWSGEGSILVIGKKGEEAVRVPALQLTSRGGALAPGEEAELVAVFPARWGPGGKEKGRVWITLSGAGIFETRLVEVQGLTLLHRFPVERRFGSAVYASIAYPTAAGRWEERTAPFRIVPPERVLAVSVSPERPEAVPLGPQALQLRVTDSMGRGVRAQVSVGVVDKAIYALQGELRPRALDFFYPLVRDNVATFTSAEFQGYGYGEALARLMRQPGHAFAAVKAPAKTREVDTAYWNPTVTTDEDGRAQVSFNLPSNQTLWTVTAVAADASGRFGEGTAEFAARGGIQLVASLPQFLREGDQAIGSVRLARGEKGGTEKLTLDVSAEGGIASPGAHEALTLGPKGEKVVPVRIEAKATGGATVALRLDGGEKPLLDRRSFPVRPRGVEERIVVSAAGSGRLALPVPQGAQVESVELALRPSTVAVALAGVEELLTYPYGCLEQLVATTIPNIALARVLEQTGALRGLDAPGLALVAEARSRAVQGVDRILALSRPGGGFTWFAGESQAGVALTLIALDGLTHAVDAGFAQRDDARIVEAVRFLDRQEGLPLSLDATRAYVLARLDGARQAARVRALLARTTAELQEDPYPVALALLAAERAGILAEPPVKAALQAQLTRVREAFLQTAELRVDPQLAWSYPLRRAGLTAILGHAASLGEVDLAKARRRLVEALSDPAALSTFERSTAILHSLWLIERDARALTAAKPPKVTVEGGAAPVLQPWGAGLRATLASGARAVTVSGFDGQVELSARVRLPLDKVTPRADGMSVARSYYRLLGAGRRRLEPGESVAQGEELYVELSLDAPGGDQWSSLRSAYYVVEDAIPAGFTPLVEDKEWRGQPWALPLSHEALKRRALSPERALFFFEEPAPWSRSPRVVGYVLRAQFPGTYAAPPATIQDMYAPRVRGRSGAATLTIQPSGASR
ncbi:MAG: MG2 domain-containing protein [Anaeromyxobacteraceae bacterium]